MSAPVVVYTKPACQQCVAVQRWLDRAGLDYVTRPITDDDAAAARSLGITAAPIVAHGDTIFGGFDPNRLEQLRKA